MYIRKMSQRKPLKIETQRHQFIKDSDATLTEIVRTELDKARVGERDYPTARRDWDKGREFRRTSIRVTDAQQEWLSNHDINFNAFVADVIDERMELERRLEEQ